MFEQILMTAPILLPVIAGMMAYLLRPKKHRRLYCLCGVAACAGTLFALFLLHTKAEAVTLYLCTLTSSVSVVLCADSISGLFGILAALIWTIVFFYALSYMKTNEHEERFFCFYFLSLAAIEGVCHAGNMVTFYMFYEMMTIVTVPLVLHEETKEAVMAAKKYLFYSIAGASMVLCGFFLMQSENGLSFFATGGVLISENSIPETKQLVAAMLMILGFGTKASMWPMHGWLPAAHPVAPSPASAVLSGIITKMGVLGIVRTCFFVFGAGSLRGTWVQYTFLGLSLLTVLMGSALAYKEKILKKRLAYSSVSQVSYILFGIFVLHPAALVGALLHTVFHAVMKNELFMGAGAVIQNGKQTEVSNLDGFAKMMPVTFLCILFSSLSMIGIPPFSGMMSKWYLCLGAIEGEIGILSYLGPIVLLVSALLTAGYLLPIVIRGFFAVPVVKIPETLREPGKMMLLPMIVLSLAALFFGIFSGGLFDFVSELSASILI